MDDQKLMLRLNQLNEAELRAYVRDEMSDTDLERYFGGHASLVRTYATAKPTEAKEGDSLIVLLPGITGSVLEDIEGPPEVIWINLIAFLKGHLRHLQMTPDGQADLVPGVRIHAPRPIWLAYAKMFLRLQYEHEVVCFPYDWRRSTVETALLLRDFIDKRLADSSYDKVTLVGHSMGGLVAMHYLTLEQTKAHAEKKVRRLIALGTPFRGSIEAVPMLSQANSPKMKLARALNKNNEPLQVVLSWPSIYQLLPAPKNLYPDWDPVPDLDIWDPQTWQTIDVSINIKHLEAAKQHHAAIAAADPQVPVFTIIGTHYNTAVRLVGNLLTGKPLFHQDGEEGGDGTVQVRSARFKNSPAYYVHEVHIELVLEDAVIDGIIDWVSGSKPDRLVADIKDVVLDDAPFRGIGEAVPHSVIDTEQMANKIKANEPLDHEELKVIMAAF